MPQITKLVASLVAGATNKNILHANPRVPSIHILGAGTGPNVSKAAIAHDATYAYYNNAGGAVQSVVALLIAIHSFESNAMAMLAGTASASGSATIPHGLFKSPDFIFAGVGTDASITPAKITSDGTNVTITGVAANAKYDLFAIALHSLWGVGQFNLISGTLPVGVNQAVAHGLIRTPTVSLLSARTGTNIANGSTSPDATNIYLSNTGASPQVYETLVIAPHSTVA